jgi:predicted secreted protein
MTRILVGALAALVASGVAAQTTLRNEMAPTPQPVLTISASAQTTIPNDRMQAVLRAEAEAPDAAQAASDVNARMARALARAKGVRGVDASTAGYSTYPVSDAAGKNPRWRVSQNLVLESSDFPALAALVTRLQSDDKLLVSGMSFSVSAATRNAAEDALTREAIKAWQQRAQVAAAEFGASSWRPGHVTIQGSEPMRPQPMFRAQAAGVAAAAPVSVEAGTTEVSVMVSGEAIVETVRAPGR